jgi:glycosyltransferase involved in cell wall biosynthesis
MKKNILIIGLGSFPGGPITSLIQLVEHINPKLFNVHILCLPNPHEESFLALKAIPHITIIPIEIYINNWLHSTSSKKQISIKRRLKSPFRFFRLLYNAIIISKVITKFEIDLVHTNIELVADGAIAALITKTPHIWHIRATIGKNGTVTHLLGARYICFIINLLSKSIVVNSNETYNSIKKYIPEQKTKLVYNGINPTDFQYIKQTNILRNTYSIPDSFKIIASIGYVSEIKGGIEFIHIANKVIKSNKNCVFIYIGPSFEGADVKCMNDSKYLINQLGIETKIIYTGYRNDIPTLLGEIDILLQPMPKGSWSRVVLEGMAAGIPVVAFEETLESEFIQHSETGLLGNTLSSCAKYIIELLDDKSLRYLIGNKGKYHVINTFSNEKTANQIEAIYLSNINI